MGKTELSELELEERKQKQREYKKQYILNNREKHISTILKCQHKRYHEDPEYRRKRVEMVSARYQYKKEAAIMRNICV